MAKVPLVILSCASDDRSRVFAGPLRGFSRGPKRAGRCGGAAAPQKAVRPRRPKRSGAAGIRPPRVRRDREPEAGTIDRPRQTRGGRTRSSRRDPKPARQTDPYAARAGPRTEPGHDAGYNWLQSPALRQPCGPSRTAPLFIYIYII